MFSNCRDIIGWHAELHTANSSLAMGSQSACNNIVPQSPLQTHHLSAARSPQSACFTLAPAVTRSLAWRPGNVVTMPAIVVSKRWSRLVLRVQKNWRKTNNRGVRIGKKTTCSSFDILRFALAWKAGIGSLTHCETVCCVVYTGPRASAGSALHMQSIRCVWCRPTQG